SGDCRRRDGFGPCGRPFAVNDGPRQPPAAPPVSIAVYRRIGAATRIRPAIHLCHGLAGFGGAGALPSARLAAAEALRRLRFSRSAAASRASRAALAGLFAGFSDTGLSLMMRQQ